MNDEQTSDNTDSAAADDTPSNPAPDDDTSNTETAKPDAAAGDDAEASAKKPGKKGEDDKPTNPKDDEDAGDGKSKDDKPKAGAVEVELAFPEGVEVDEAVLGAFKGLVGELGLDSDQAQRFVDLQTRLVTAQRDAFADTLKGWSDTAAADKEIGGLAFAENVATARKALEKFGTPELCDALTSTGLGNHPELVRTFVRIGKAMGDGKFVSGSPETGKRDAADVFYDADGQE